MRIERVRPAADPDCGAPDDARGLLITALGEFPATEATARSLTLADGVDIAIDGFPVETTSLEVEVLGFGGAVRAVGRTQEFAIESLDDEAVITVFMAPQGGFCPTGPPIQVRDAPLVARAGGAVLIAGGSDGAPVHEVELYDPATGLFSSLGQPLYGSDLGAGLAGASMTAMPDGHVVVAGGGATAFQVYEPGAGEFGAPQFLREARAHHAAVALDADHLLLAGGCAQLDGAGCIAGSGLSTSVVLEVSTGQLSDGPGLSRLRVGGSALREADGRVLLTGGTDGDGAPVGEAERVDPTGARPAELVASTGSAAALLAAGGALTGFAPRGAPPSQTAAVVPPGAILATQVTASLDPRAGPALVPLETGQVLVIGGGAAAAALYAPATGALEPLSSAPGSGERSGHAAIRLGDGSVLVIGGRDAEGAPLGDAWIFRPALTGPWSGGLSATFATPESAAPMVPRDPARARAVPAEGATPAHYRIEASGADGAPSEWAILAGPRFTSLALEASVAAEQGGVAILLWFRDEATTAVLALRPGQDAELFEIAAGEQRPLGSCAGQPIADADLAPPDGAGHAIAVSASRGELTATLDGREVLRCDVDPPAAGLVGVAPLGGEGALLRLDLVSVSR